MVLMSVSVLSDCIVHVLPLFRRRVLPLEIRILGDARDMIARPGLSMTQTGVDGCWLGWVIPMRVKVKAALLVVSLIRKNSDMSNKTETRRFPLGSSMGRAWHSTLTYVARDVGSIPTQRVSSGIPRAF